MSGLLGALKAGLAGGAKGAAEAYAAQESFNMKRALLEAESEKQILLKEMGYELEERYAQQHRDKVKAVTDNVKDPDEGKGGYESPEAKEKREAGLIRQKRDALVDAGYYDEAKVYDSDLTNRAKNDLAQEKLDLTRQQIEGRISEGQERLRLQGEANAAKAEAAATRAAKAPAPSDREKLYAAYKRRIEAEGKKPMTYDAWDIWMKRNVEKSTPMDTVTESEEVYDDETGGSKKTTRTSKVPSGGKGKSGSDPLGLRK